jgi:hypothetical protein
MGAVIAVIWAAKEAECFFGYGWTGSIGLIWFSNFR